MNGFQDIARQSARGLGFLGLVVLVGAALALAEPRFLSTASLNGVARHMAANGLAALGLTFVVIVRKFDLSISGVAAFTAMSMGTVIAAGAPLWLAVAAGIAIGAVIGLISGTAISRFGLPDIVTTIAVGSICAGMAFLYTGGRSIFQNFFQVGITDLNDARLLGLGVSLWILLAVYAVAWFVMQRTRTGMAFYATGENPVAAHFSGIATRRYIALAYVLCAICTVLAVLLILAESGNAETNKGANLMMPAYAGVFLGAAILGGTSVLATLGGILLITMLLDGFSLMGVPYYYSDGVISLILLAGVLAFSDTARGYLAGLAAVRALRRARSGGKA
ncbi:ABC transporter permease [Frigidibacter mobilis]|uniref:ABC transporter membrane spanning protein n=1 Tax=Frigidibacter mobilis TaxID=1335048 RepID=A0A159ZAK3_9RHOB|nr:ABC transporter permease [Frigidibacter mobilis]AMY71998.1 ABC transporter membrane spanning protein [Frigidibacter mobilis]